MDSLPALLRNPSAQAPNDDDDEEEKNDNTSLIQG